MKTTKTKSKMSKTSAYWQNNCETVCTGVRYNKSTGTYYVRKNNSYLGSTSSKKVAMAAYKSGNKIS